MLRVMKWTLPVMAFGVVLALSGIGIAAEDGAGAAGAKGKLTGTVQLEDGSPAANAMIRVVTPPAKGAKAPEKEPKPQAADEGAAKPAQDKPGEGEKPAAKPDRPKPVAEGKTDAQGKFEIEVPAGKYTVIASLRGQGNTRKTIEVKAGQTMDLGTMTLKKQAPKKEKEPAAPST